MSREYLDGQPVPRGVSVAKLSILEAQAAAICDLEDALDAATTVGAEPDVCWLRVGPALRRLADQIERAADRRQEIADLVRQEQSAADDAAELEAAQ